MPTKLNPLALIDQILADWASPKVRRLLHLIILLVVALVTLVLAAEGNWKEALISLVATAYAASNKANTSPDDGALPEDPYPEGYSAALLAEQGTADDSAAPYDASVSGNERTFHMSDCAVHNEPAMPAGPCNCGLNDPLDDLPYRDDNLRFPPSR